MMPSIHVCDSFTPIEIAVPPFDIRRAVYDASTIDGIIYIHPLLFDSVYRYASENIDRPWMIDPHGTGISCGRINVVVTDLLPENEYRVMTEKQFQNEFGKNIQ